jgi:CheY-like chemotaxis protein
MEKTSTIMLVDDSESDLDLMRFAFKKARIPNPICEMHDGEEAIEYLNGNGDFADRARYPLPCLIITDLKMPRVDGFGLLEWLKTRPELDRVPRIVLTASEHEKDQKRAGDVGGCAYFVKPSQLDRLVELVVKMDEAWISEHCPLQENGLRA